MVTKTEPYELLARLYDLEWSGFADRYANFLKNQIGPREAAEVRVLDLGCGTGSLAIQLGLQGHPVLGLDMSDSMIRVARAKVESLQNVRFSVQRIEDFVVDEQFHLVTCTFGTLNYILNLDDLRHVFHRVEHTLPRDGIFVFDLNTGTLYAEHHHGVIERDLGGTHVVQELEFDSGSKLASTVFRFPGGLVEHHVQRAYEFDEFMSLLGDCGLGVKQACSNLKGDPLTRHSERVICVVGKDVANPGA